MAIDKRGKQNKKMKNYFIIVIFVLLGLLSGIFLWMREAMPEYDFEAMMASNVIMAVLALITWLMVRARLSGRPQAFVGGVFSSTFLKLFVCIVGVLGYAMVNKPNVHKPTLFVMFGIYIVYSAAETIMLQKMARQTK
jgi:hypothetical protein